jgi:hypothetical protein
VVESAARARDAALARAALDALVELTGRVRSGAPS